MFHSKVRAAIVRQRQNEGDGAGPRHISGFPAIGQSVRLVCLENLDVDRAIELRVWLTMELKSMADEGFEITGHEPVRKRDWIGQGFPDKFNRVGVCLLNDDVLHASSANVRPMHVNVYARSARRDESIWPPESAAQGSVGRIYSGHRVDE